MSKKYRNDNHFLIKAQEKSELGYSHYLPDTLIYILYFQLRSIEQNTIFLRSLSIISSPQNNLKAKLQSRKSYKAPAPPQSSPNWNQPSNSNQSLPGPSSSTR